MYIRKAYIEVFQKKDDAVPAMVIEGLRITGEVKYAYDSADVVARLVVYNLSLENRKALLVKDKSNRQQGGGLISGTYYIKLYAGHVDEHFVGGEKPLILQGPIVNVFSFNKRPETYTVIYAVPSGQALSLNTIEQFPASSNMNIGEALKELGRRGGYDVVDISRLPDYVSKAPARGMVFGTEVSIQKEFYKLGETYNFMTRFSANKITVKMKAVMPLRATVDGSDPLEKNLIITYASNDTARTIETYKITVDMVRENPRVGSASVKLSVSLAPELEHVEVIDLTEVRGQLMFDDIGDVLYRDDSVRQYLTSDLYRVSSVVHIFDTHGQAWHTYIEAHLFYEGRAIEGS